MQKNKTSLYTWLLGVFILVVALIVSTQTWMPENDLSDAFRFGYLDYNQGVRLQMSPYETDSIEDIQWRDGWLTRAKEKQIERRKGKHD